MKKLLRGSLLCGCAALVGFPTTVLAQGTSQNVMATPSADANGEPVGLADIVVTAQKRSESINKVPMSITALSNLELRKAGISSVEDLAKIVPSFTSTQSFNGAPVYTLRGIGFFDAALGSRPTIGLYQDEVELPFSIMAKGAVLDLERVEVLKGPQGTLFGQNATGGLINYIAAKPTEELRYGGQASVGRFGRGTLEAFVSGGVGSTISMRVAGRQDFGGDWQSSQTRNDSLGSKNQTSLRAIVDWTPSDRVLIRLNVNGWNDRSDSQAGQLVQIVTRLGPYPLLDGSPLAPKRARAADWTPGFDYRNDLKFRQSSVRADIELNDQATLTSLTAYSELHGTTSTDGDGTAIDNVRVFNRVKQKNVSQEVRLAGDLDERIKYVLGGSYAWYRANQTERQEFQQWSGVGFLIPFGAPGPYTGSEPFTNATYKTASAFANIDYSISDTLVAHVGVRYSQTRARASSCTHDLGGVSAAGFSGLYTYLRSILGLGGPVSIAPGGCINVDDSFVPGLTNSRIKEDGIPFRVGIDWNLNPTTLIYANVSRGFKGGSFPVINSSAQTQNVPATQEKLVAYEAGFKSGLFDRRLQVNGAAFYYDYTDKQITGAILDPVSGPLQKVVNLPKSRVLGAELQVNWAPIDHLKIASSGTYISTKIRGCPTVNATSVQPGCQTGGYYSYDSFGVLVPLTGDSFPNVSKWSGSIDAEYSYPISSSAQIMVGGLLSYQSSKMAQLGTNSALGAANPDRIFEIPSYALLDLRIGIEDRDGRWRAELFGRNVTNKYYRTGIQRANDTITAWTGMPATYGVTVSFRN